MESNQARQLPKSWQNQKELSDLDNQFEVDDFDEDLVEDEFDEEYAMQLACDILKSKNLGTRPNPEEFSRLSWETRNLIELCLMIKVVSTFHTCGLNEFNTWLHTAIVNIIADQHGKHYQGGHVRIKGLAKIAPPLVRALKASGYHSYQKAENKVGNTYVYFYFPQQQ